MFVTGRYTAISLLVASLLLWLLGLFFSVDEVVTSGQLIFSGLSISAGWVGYLLSFPIFVLVAYILNSLVILETRTPWLASLFLYLLSMNFYLHGNIQLAISLLFFIFSITMLSTCIVYDGVERRVYSIFLLIASSALIFPQFIYLIPIFFLYLFIAEIFKIKTLFAALLGFVTPFWLLFGSEYIYPKLNFITRYFISGVSELFVLHSNCSLTIAQILFMSIEMMLIIQSVWLLVATSNPAKPVMRRMLSLFVITNIYLWTLSWFVAHNYDMFLMWRLPGTALMLAYVITVKITKLSNIYFVILNVLLLLVAFFGLWNG